MTLAIGDRLRFRRKELGMTLQLLADISGLTASFISQAERNKTTPSIASLMLLSKSLGVQIEYFMEAPSSVNAIHRAKNPDVIETDSVLQMFQLSREIEFRQGLNVVQIYIPPGETLPEDNHNGELFVYVVSGELHLLLNENYDLLKKGDSVHIDARVPHELSNKSRRELNLLYIEAHNEE